MTSLKRLVVAVGLAVMGLCTTLGSAQATISYEGQIGNEVSPHGSVTGSVTGNGWTTSNLSGIDFWSFQGHEGDVVDIWALRGDAGLDLAFSLYSNNPTFNPRGNSGGMTFVAVADDELRVPFGPYGDPALYRQTIGTDGLYTIAIGGFNSDVPSASYDYTLSIGLAGSAPTNSPVPLPGAAWLLGSGLAGLVGLRRNKNA